MAVKRFETHLPNSQGQELYLQVWSPEIIKGNILITHGQAEHGDCYQRLAEELSKEGWRVFAWDLIGHGRSEGKRGYVDHFQTYVKDLKKVTDHIREKHPIEQPFLLFSHSLGGLITLSALLDEDLGQVDGAIFSSPALGFSMQIPNLKKNMAKLALHFLPQLTMHNEIKYGDLSRDADMLKHYEKDTLRHNRISAAVFFGMLHGFERMPEDVQNIQIPVFFQLAGEDKLVSTPSAKLVYEKMTNPKNRIKVYLESFHEIYNDLDRSRVVSDLKEFINTFV